VAKTRVERMHAKTRHFPGSIAIGKRGDPKAFVLTDDEARALRDALTEMLENPHAAVRNA
jgi:hypothetical protein